MHWTPFSGLVGLRVKGEARLGTMTTAAATTTTNRHPHDHPPDHSSAEYTI